MTWRRWAALSSFALAASLVPRPAAAQLAPTGGHYAARGSDTGYAGEVNSSGGYGASVPLDLPGARNGLPITLHIVYGERGVGAAGAGWDVPLSYIRRDSTFAHRRPVGTAGVDPQSRDQVSLVLEGRRMNLVQTASGWVAQRDAPDLAIHQDANNNWVMYDGQGRTYLFTVPDSALSGAGIWLLASITGPGGNNVALSYTVAGTGIASVVSLDLAGVQYNPDTSGCYKHAVTLGYDTASTVMSFSSVGSVALMRLHPLTSVSVTSRATCGSSPETLRSYQLTYAQDPDTGLKRLTDVQMKGRQGTPEASTPVPVAHYTYGTASTGGKLTYQSTSSTVLVSDSYPLANTDLDTTLPLPRAGTGYATLRSFMDVSGDGRPDLVHANGSISRNTSSGGTTSFGAGALGFMVPAELRATSEPRYTLGDGTIQDDTVWRQAIDFDGDGRIDVVNVESPGTWTVYLNTPDPADPRNILWQSRTISTAALAGYLQARGLWSDPNWVPLALRSTMREYVYHACAIWSPPQHQWIHFVDDGSVVNGHCPPIGDLISTGLQSTVTLWELKDINGDGYPDVAFNSSAIITVQSIQQFPPPHPVNFVPVNANLTVTSRLSTVNEIDAVFNIAGVHLSAGTDVFSAPVTLRSPAPCGVGQWTAVDATHQQLACGIVDVNGDGVADLVSGTSVFLGSASRGAGAFFTPTAIMTLPGPLSIQANTQLTSCALPATGSSRFTVSQTAGLRDLTGDGIPDYVSQDAAGNWSVAVGTGVGFAGAIPISASGFSLSSEHEDCAGTLSDTFSGLYDIDGDGKADLISSLDSGGALSVRRLLGSGAVPGAPEAGRLVQIDNGYGAQTTITYRSAKDDASTLHQVPFPEIVVSSVKTTGTQGLGGTLAATQYAYGGADLVFDPALDTFSFPGYRRRVELHVPDGETLGLATITDAFAPATRTDPYGLLLGDGTLAFMSQAQRYDLYLRIGRTTDVTVLSGSIGVDAWALLSANVASDSHRIAGAHYDWSSQLLAAASDPASPENCWEMVRPYDFPNSSLYWLYFGAIDVCAAHGFGFVSSVQSWHGEPGSGPSSPASVATRTDVGSVDSFGRVLSVTQLNDVNRTDDDVCIDTTYATPTGSNERVLSAVSSRRISNCGSVTYAKDTFEYDKLAVGSGSAGFPTAHTVERRDELGALLDTVREHDTTFDAVGNPLIVTTAREGAVTRTATVAYDAFGLVPMTITVAATGIAATQVAITRDAVTLNVLSTTDLNGTQRGTVFDGFDRPVLSTVTPPGGTLGVLSWTRYLGFEVGSTGGRTIAQRVFTDPVAHVSSPGRDSTVFLDELGRAGATKLTLGADYGTQMLVAGARTYDSFGRVVFEADPFSSTAEQFVTAYGTTYYYNADGTPSYAIRGYGKQPVPTGAACSLATDESHGDPRPGLLASWRFGAGGRGAHPRCEGESERE